MIEDLVKQIEARFAELGEQMTDPDVISDRERYAAVGRAYRQLAPAAALAADWRRAHDDAEGAEALLSEEGEDAELRDELARARERIGELDEEIRLAMLERDPNDDKSVIIEIQGGSDHPDLGPPAEQLGFARLAAGDRESALLLARRADHAAAGAVRCARPSGPR